MPQGCDKSVLQTCMFSEYDTRPQPPPTRRTQEYELREHVVVLGGGGERGRTVCFIITIHRFSIEFGGARIGLHTYEKHCANMKHVLTNSQKRNQPRLCDWYLEWGKGLPNGSINSMLILILYIISLTVS